MESEIILGDNLEILKGMESDSIQMALTSPPYWSLRYYSAENNPKEIGREKTWVEYKNKLLEIFAEVKRVLKPDGVFFLNLGDVYISSGGKRGRESNIRTPNWQPEYGVGGEDEKLPAGCQLGLPWRVAFAMTDEQGWYLRNDLVWVKVQAKPESINTRFSKKHEFIFMMTKGMKYYFNLNAVRVPFLVSPESNAVFREVERYKYDPKNQYASSDKMRTYGQLAKKGTMEILSDMLKNGKNGANPGDWFIIPPAGDETSHTAAYSEHLCHRPILACSRPGDFVLDPFSGTGTTCAAAKRFGRNYIGIELYEEYHKVSVERLKLVQEEMISVEDELPVEPQYQEGDLSFGE